MGKQHVQWTDMKKANLLRKMRQVSLTEKFGFRVNEIVRYKEDVGRVLEFADDNAKVKFPESTKTLKIADLSKDSKTVMTFVKDAANTGGPEAMTLWTHVDDEKVPRLKRVMEETKEQAEADNML